MASTVGKVELESAGDETPEERVVERLITKALHTTFGRHVSVDELDGVIEAFEDGLHGRDRRPNAVARVRGLDARGPGPGATAVRGLGTFDVTDGAEEPAVVASAVEFLLEGLHLARRLNKDRIPGGTVYHR